MPDNNFSEFFLTSLQVMSALFIFVVGLIVLVVIVTFILDVTQNKQAIRRNYPVIGRFRYLFETLGEFFRQYFLQWIEKSSLLTAHSEHGYIERQKMCLIHEGLVLPEI